MTTIDHIDENSQLYAGPVTPAITKLTSHKEVETERWQDVFKPGALSVDITRSGKPDEYMKIIRQRVLRVLGPNPTPKQRAKVKADLMKVKPSIPPALYRKYLCDLETGHACPATP